MDVTAILDRLHGLGVHIEAAGQKLRLTPGSRVPPELVEALRQNKAALLVALLEQASPGEHAEALEDMLRLGRRLALGEIKAVRCGLTGRYCRDCHGVPCLGSVPWGEYGQRAT